MLRYYLKSKGRFGGEVFNKNCFKNSIIIIDFEKLEERVGEDEVEEIDRNPKSLEDVLRETQWKLPVTEDIASKKCHVLGRRWNEGSYKMLLQFPPNSREHGTFIKHLHYILHLTSYILYY
jgi:hypothetical protein